MKKLKLVVSDFHLGKGSRLPSGNPNVMEDFHLDHKFKEFLEFYSKGDYEEHEIELILNGDILNLIQVDYHGHYTVVITEGVSVHKLEAIIKGHPDFFKALTKFLKNPKHALTYVVGNHDQEMMWPKARELFEKAVGSTVNWRNSHYLVDGLYVEHGHQYEAINRVDPQLPFLTKNLPEPILNLPWGTLFTIQYIIRLKQQRPFIDKVRPFNLLIWWSLLHDTWATLANLFRLVMYFTSTRFSKNRYRHSNFRMTLKMLREASIFPELADSAKRILRTPEIHTVVFGHTHVYRQLVIADGKQYLNTGSWTDIVSLDLESYARRQKLTYVRMEYDETGRPLSTLRHWIGKIPLEDDAMAF
jgi:UDP-2,3-diacylglucosamine pyrophosphatase LpxH